LLSDGYLPTIGKLWQTLPLNPRPADGAFSGGSRPAVAGPKEPMPVVPSGWLACRDGRSAQMNERKVLVSWMERVNGRDWVSADAKLVAPLD